MVRVNRLFITILVVSNIIKFIEGLILYVSNNPDCFFLVDSSKVYHIILYGLLLIITDYSLIIAGLLLFHSKPNSANPQVFG